MHVVKIGGNVVDDEVALDAVLDRCAAWADPFILVHGGGKVATQMAAALGVEQTMVDGRRITDAATLRIVTMTYAGLINKTIVARLQARGVNALGLTGADGDLLRAHRRRNTTTDFGFVGDVDHVRGERLRQLLQAGFQVVLAPLTHDGAGTMLNTNADTIAAEVAIALGAGTRLTYLFDLPGVMLDVADVGSVLPELDRQRADTLIAEGRVVKGMRPKLDNAFRAAAAGCTVRITNQDAMEGGTWIR